tara:strand:- start:147 stop:341 length:195 start_codon:yes stop_codon:yes gene_type:complete
MRHPPLLSLLLWCLRATLLLQGEETAKRSRKYGRGRIQFRSKSDQGAKEVLLGTLDLLLRWKGR